MSVELVLADDMGESRHSILRRKAPITESEWISRLESTLSKDDDLALSALGADRGYLSISCDRFGVHRAPVGVFAEPVRWNVSREESLQLRLRIRCDGIEIPSIVHYPFDAPAAGHEITFEEMSRGLASANGLFVAFGEGAETRLVVSSPPRVVQGLEGLRAVAASSSPMNLAPSIVIEAYRKWAHAPIVGKFAEIHRENVVTALHQQLIAAVAGRDWVRHEQSAIRNNTLAALDERVAPRTRNYGITLGMRRGPLSEEDLFKVFRTASKDYGIAADLSLMQCAWKLAFDPSGLPKEWTLPDADLGEPLGALTRGARVLKLHHDRRETE